jgi:hypothetical protein
MRKFLPIPLGQAAMGLCWLAVALLVFRDIASMSAAEEGGMGPGTYPKILAVSLTVLVLIYWVQSRREKAALLTERSEARDKVRAACLVGLAFAAARLWESVGALPILLALSAIELRWLEGFGWTRVAAVSVILSAGIWLVFTQLLGVSLPLGLLIFFY